MLQLGAKGINLGQQGRERCFDDPPNHRLINRVVAVRETVPKADDLSITRDSFNCQTIILFQPETRHTDNLNVALNRGLEQAIRLTVS